MGSAPEKVGDVFGGRKDVKKRNKKCNDGWNPESDFDPGGLKQHCGLQGVVFYLTEHPDGHLIGFFQDFFAEPAHDLFIVKR